jgi:hypothetical protein
MLLGMLGLPVQLISEHFGWGIFHQRICLCRARLSLSLNLHVRRSGRTRPPHMETSGVLGVAELCGGDGTHFFHPWDVLADLGRWNLLFRQHIARSDRDRSSDTSLARECHVCEIADFPVYVEHRYSFRGQSWALVAGTSRISRLPARDIAAEANRFGQEDDIP